MMHGQQNVKQIYFILVFSQTQFYFILEFLWTQLYFILVFSQT